ncbi:hypothetical protein Cgig2_000849 [Carnegiea gigantea]|uniref:Uncharacterized protein n=1 Tax=Carnegiea gigantea TaxID=171969 RepID=A0A9Q1GT31_9CARY|nr:hypothetical protein Cgig2_000849 [Carnegiea gigantea]
MDPVPTPMGDDQLRAYIPSQPNNEGFQNQPFTIEDIGDTSVLGHVVSAWQDSPTSTYSPISQGAQNEGGGDGKGKRALESSSLETNKSSKTTGPKRMGSAAMMYEKLESMMEAIILEKKERDVEREAIRIEREQRRIKRDERRVEREERKV